MAADMEDALDGVKAHLTANLEATLVAIEAARSVTIPRWKEITTAPSKSRQYPQISILPDTSVPDYENEDAPLADGWDGHHVNILVTQAGNNAEVVQYTLLRYREAIRGIVKADYRFGNRFEVVYLRGADYSPMVEAEKGGELLQVLFVDLEVREIL